MKNNVSIGLTLTAMLFACVVNAQIFVSTTPQNKNVVLEEFTGVGCPNCPGGHQIAQQIVEANPGRAWVIAFHPYNSSYTTPMPGDPDFRRHHPDSLYKIPYCGTSRYMPSAFINRRTYGGERLQGASAWTAKTNEILTEPSPVNVAIGTSYDATTKILSLMVEIYFTSTLTDAATLNVALTESNLVSQQEGATGPYVHKRIFRETFTAQWGDPVTEPTTQGSYITKTFTFDNSVQNYDMDTCEIVAYIVNANNDEVISSYGLEVGDNPISMPFAAFTYVENPAPGQTSLDFTDVSTGSPTSWLWSFEGGTPATSTDQNPQGIVYNFSGDYKVTLTATNQFGQNSKTDTITIVITGVNEPAGEQLLVFPNPSTGRFYISQIPEPCTITIINAASQMVRQLSIASKTDHYSFDLSELKRGIYYLRIKTNTKTWLQKLVLVN